MAGTKPESTFIKSVHKHTTCYHEKMCNPFTSGTPDVWYSGPKGDLWVEYKYLTSLPSLPRTVLKPALSARQALWLRREHLHGRNVAVILGSPKGAVVFRNLEWEGGISLADFQSRLQSRAQTAQWIDEQCGEELQFDPSVVDDLDSSLVDV